jgi:mycoredoxin
MAPASGVFTMRKLSKRPHPLGVPHPNGAPPMSDQIEAVDFYWRPGCGFCMALDRSLTKAGVPMTQLNRWDDADHAETVRTHANGNETVPTVVVGRTAQVNPPLGQVIEALRTESPHQVPVGADDPGPVGRLTQRLFGS